ncbi:MAG: hypothetical protein KatS3mg111_0199 [Pirellulaceae bacterium]|nr:MAG: hypothetical protein KatS3mg111_0199 [Pirellulaceae bacterium]
MAYWMPVNQSGGQQWLGNLADNFYWEQGTSGADGLACPSRQESFRLIPRIRQAVVRSSIPVRVKTRWPSMPISSAATRWHGVRSTPHRVEPARSPQRFRSSVSLR